MSDPHRYVEVTRHSWGSRVGGSFKGVVVGLVIVVVAIGVLFWNEGRAVKRERALAEGAGAVVSIEASGGQVPADGALVHLSGLADTTARLVDAEFGIEVAPAIKLRRVARIYHWEERTHSETSEQVGGSAEVTTTYTYERVWTTSAIDSSRFKRSQNHYNPPMAYPSASYRADEVSLGDHLLSVSLIDAINRYATLPPATNSVAGATPPGRLYGSEYYIGADPANPQIGDQRIHFEVVTPLVVSVVAARNGRRLSPYTTSDGEQTIELLEVGQKSAAAMFAEAQAANSRLTWIIRGGGLFALFIGFVTILRPLRMVAALLPFLGRLTDGLISLVSGLLALIVGLLVVAVAWLFYRPLLAFGLLAAAIGLLYATGRIGRGQPADPVAPGRSAAAPPPPPPPAAPPPPPPPGIH